MRPPLQMRVVLKFSVDDGTWVVTRALKRTKGATV